MGMKNLVVAAMAAIGAWSILTPAMAQDAAGGKAVFQSQCSICHSPLSGRNMVGPSLFGVVGRQAGKEPGFHYSAANEKSGLTWDTATLDVYLTNPAKTVPHTIMSYPGLKDDQKRGNLIAYLSTLH